MRLSDHESTWARVAEGEEILGQRHGGGGEQARPYRVGASRQQSTLSILPENVLALM